MGMIRSNELITSNEFSHQLQTSKQRTETAQVSDMKMISQLPDSSFFDNI